mmetsp:Transcript_27946/g.70697  ORF Transcript_27946/g.70697 Transcript_27946/m.70697 type:complete len:241 (-) Transcript_27946:181-903(-)
MQLPAKSPRCRAVFLKRRLIQLVLLQEFLLEGLALLQLACVGTGDEGFRLRVLLLNLPIYRLLLQNRALHLASLLHLLHTFHVVAFFLCQCFVVVFFHHCEARALYLLQRVRPVQVVVLFRHFVVVQVFVILEHVFAVLLHHFPHLLLHSVLFPFLGFRTRAGDDGGVVAEPLPSLLLAVLFFHGLLEQSVDLFVLWLLHHLFILPDFGSGKSDPRVLRRVNPSESERGHFLESVGTGRR